jgi:D-alanyl-D-alanine carboxypeptidase
VEGPKPSEIRSNDRLTPPGNVRYTNALPGQAPVADEAQPLPAATSALGKQEERLPDMKARAEIAAHTPPPVPEVTGKARDAAEPPKAAPARLAAAEPAKAAPAPAKAVVRSGWMIQLAAADSDAKAREILSNAKAKSGTALASAEPFTESVTKGNATFYRARFGGFDEDGAQAACKAVKRAGFNCFAQRL